MLIFSATYGQLLKDWAGCQNNLIDVNFRLQNVWKALIKKSADRIWSKNDKEIKVSPLRPIRVKQVKQYQFIENMPTSQNDGP